MVASYLRNGGKSRRAYDAEADGRFPLSRAKRELANKLGIKQRVAEAILRATHAGEYHHTGMYASETLYYDVAGLCEEIDEAGGLNVWLASEEGEKARQAIAELSPKPQKPAEERYENCHVEWLEWSGSRAHPKADKCEADGCTVVLRGQTYHITLPSGQALRKRVGCRGLNIQNDSGMIH